MRRMVRRLSIRPATWLARKLNAWVIDATVERDLPTVITEAHWALVEADD